MENWFAKSHSKRPLLFIVGHIFMITFVKIHWISRWFITQTFEIYISIETVEMNIYNFSMKEGTYFYKLDFNKR